MFTGEVCRGMAVPSATDRLGISEAGYWDCGGRLGKGGIINCRLVPDSGVGRWPWP